MGTAVWRNWSGTQTCETAAYVRASSVEQVREVVVRAHEQGVTVRPVGSGHSFPPLVPCEGVILDVSGLAGIESIDHSLRRVRVWAGTIVRSLGDPLWDAGLSLRNQGDIDAQTVAGVVSTATHGAGLGYTSFSGMVTRAELVTASGDVLVVDEDDPRLPAVQTSVGSLGILTNLELELMPAYKLAERIEYWPLGQVLDRWAFETQNRRAFQFFWGPYEGSLELYGMPPAPSGMEQACYVRTYVELPADATEDLTPSGRVDRAYRIYPGEYPPGWDELEYFVPYDVALDALAAIRPVLDKFPDQRYPVEVRTIAAEAAFLSPMHGRDSVSISLSGAIGTDYGDFLHAVDDALHVFGARPHWGKTHFFGADRLRDVYPRYDDFVAVRRELDPQGSFLNPHLSRMLA